MKPIDKNAARGLTSSRPGSSDHYDRARQEKIYKKSGGKPEFILTAEMMEKARAEHEQKKLEKAQERAERRKTRRMKALEISGVEAPPIDPDQSIEWATAINNGSRLISDRKARSELIQWAKVILREAGRLKPRSSRRSRGRTPREPRGTLVSKVYEG
jgi:hypothetical protein